MLLQKGLGKAAVFPKCAKLATSWRSITEYRGSEQLFFYPSENNGYKVSLSPKGTSLPLGISTSKHEVTPKNFRENPAFTPLLQETIKNEVHNDFAFIIEAGVHVNSFMPIYDFREIPRYQRIPDVDSILGYIRVDEQGKMIPGAYEPNDLYRLCNGTGLIKLSDHLYDVMRRLVENRS